MAPVTRLRLHKKSRVSEGQIFYWTTIMFSQTLGTALGDWAADSKTGFGLGYEGGALVFAAGLAIVAAAYFWTKISHTILSGRHSSSRDRLGPRSAI